MSHSPPHLGRPQPIALPSTLPLANNNFAHHSLPHPPASAPASSTTFVAPRIGALSSGGLKSPLAPHQRHRRSPASSFTAERRAQRNSIIEAAAAALHTPNALQGSPEQGLGINMGLSSEPSSSSTGVMGLGLGIELDVGETIDLASPLIDTPPAHVQHATKGRLGTRATLVDFNALGMSTTQVGNAASTLSALGKKAELLASAGSLTHSLSAPTLSATAIALPSLDSSLSSATRLVAPLPTSLFGNLHHLLPTSSPASSTASVMPLAHELELAQDQVDDAVEIESPVAGLGLGLGLGFDIPGLDGDLHLGNGGHLTAAELAHDDESSFLDPPSPTLDVDVSASFPALSTGAGPTTPPLIAATTFLPRLTSPTQVSPRKRMATPLITASLYVSPKKSARLAGARPRLPSIGLGRGRGLTLGGALNSVGHKKAFARRVYPGLPDVDLSKLSASGADSEWEELPSPVSAAFVSPQPQLKTPQALSAASSPSASVFSSGILPPLSTPDLSSLPGAFLASPVLPTSFADFTSTATGTLSGAMAEATLEAGSLFEKVTQSARLSPVPSQVMPSKARNRFERIRRSPRGDGSTTTPCPPSATSTALSINTDLASQYIGSSSALSPLSPSLVPVSPSGTPTLSPSLTFTSAFGDPLPSDVSAPNTPVPDQGTPMANSGNWAAQNASSNPIVPNGHASDAAIFDVAITSTIIGAIICLSAVGWLAYKMLGRKKGRYDGSSVGSGRSSSSRASSFVSQDEKQGRLPLSRGLQAPPLARLSQAHSSHRGSQLYSQPNSPTFQSGFSSSGRWDPSGQEHSYRVELASRSGSRHSTRERRESTHSRRSSSRSGGGGGGGGSGGRDTPNTRNRSRSTHRNSTASSVADSTWASSSERTHQTSRTSHHGGAHSSHSNGKANGSSIVSATPPRLPEPVTVTRAEEDDAEDDSRFSLGAVSITTDEHEVRPPVPMLPFDLREFASPIVPAASSEPRPSTSGGGRPRANSRTKDTRSPAASASAGKSVESEEMSKKKERRRATMDGSALETAKVQTLLFQQQLDAATANLKDVNALIRNKRDSREAAANVPEQYKDDPFIRAEARLTSRHSVALTNRSGASTPKKTAANSPAASPSIAQSGGASSVEGTPTQKKKKARPVTMPSMPPAIVVSDHPAVLAPPKSPARSRAGSTSAGSSSAPPPPLPKVSPQKAREQEKKVASAEEKVDHRLSIKTTETTLPWLMNSPSNASGLSGYTTRDDAASVMDPDLSSRSAGSNRRYSVGSNRYSYPTSYANAQMQEEDEGDLAEHRLSIGTTFTQEISRAANGAARRRRDSEASEPFALDRENDHDSGPEDSPGRRRRTLLYSVYLQRGLISPEKAGGGTDSDESCVDPALSKRGSLVNSFPDPPPPTSASTSAPLNSASSRTIVQQAQADIGFDSRLAGFDLDFDMSRIGSLLDQGKQLATATSTSSMLPATAAYPSPVTPGRATFGEAPASSTPASVGGGRFAAISSRKATSPPGSAPPATPLGADISSNASSPWTASSTDTILNAPSSATPPPRPAKAATRTSAAFAGSMPHLASPTPHSTIAALGSPTLGAKKTSPTSTTVSTATSSASFVSAQSSPTPSVALSSRLPLAASRLAASAGQASSPLNPATVRSAAAAASAQTQAPVRSFAADLQDSVGTPPSGYDSDTLLMGASGAGGISSLFRPQAQPAYGGFGGFAAANNLYTGSYVSESSESLVEQAAIGRAESIKFRSGKAQSGVHNGHYQAGAVPRLPNGRRLWESSEEESASCYEESDADTAMLKGIAMGRAGGAQGAVAR